MSLLLTRAAASFARSMRRWRLYWMTILPNAAIFHAFQTARRVPTDQRSERWMRSAAVAALSPVGCEYYRGRSHTSRGQVGRDDFYRPLQGRFPSFLMRT